MDIELSPAQPSFISKMEEDSAPAPVASNVGLMREIIKKQRANGSFSLDALVGILNVFHSHFFLRNCFCRMRLWIL
jgi:hypothetical protein